MAHNPLHVALEKIWNAILWTLRLSKVVNGKNSTQFSASFRNWSLRSRLVMVIEPHWVRLSCFRLLKHLSASPNAFCYIWCPWSWANAIYVAKKCLVPSIQCGNDHRWRDYSTKEFSRHVFSRLPFTPRNWAAWSLFFGIVKFHDVWFWRTTNAKIRKRSLIKS